MRERTYLKMNHTCQFLCEEEKEADRKVSGGSVFFHLIAIW